MAQFIVKFNDSDAVRDFRDAISARPEYSNIRCEASVIMPDVVLYNVQENQVDQLRELTDFRARFIPDFAHDLFRN